MVKKRNIVVLGAGFAGLRAAQDLSRKLKGSSYEIILVDRRDVHIFPADLFEVATAFNKEITEECMLNLSSAVATPIRSLISENVKFLNDEIVNIDSNIKIVKLKNHADLHYDYLLVALGSEVNYFGIPGLKENSFTLKTVKDALVINCHLDHHFQQLWREDKDQQVYINIGGAGATGVELAAELFGYLDCLCKKYNYKRSSVHVRLIEGSNKLVGMEGAFKKIVLKRLKKLNVEVCLNTFINELSKDKVFATSGSEKKELDNNVFIWTGGVQVSQIVQKTLGSKQGSGAILVNPFLQSNVDSNIFAAGDSAYYLDPVRGPLPMMAEPAYKSGALVAKNILNQIKGRPLRMLNYPKMRMILPLGGKYALFISGNLILKGFFAWLLRRVIYLRYNLTIMSLFSALAKTFHSTKIFMKND